MERKKGNFFVPNQGCLTEKEEKDAVFWGLPEDIPPLWQEAGGAAEAPNIGCSKKKLPDFSKGGEKLW